MESNTNRTFIERSIERTDIVTSNNTVRKETNTLNKKVLIIFAMLITCIILFNLTDIISSKIHVIETTNGNEFFDKQNITPKLIKTSDESSVSQKLLMLSEESLVTPMEKTNVVKSIINDELILTTNRTATYKAIPVDPTLPEIAEFLQIVRDKTLSQIDLLDEETKKYFDMNDDSETTVEIRGETIIVTMRISFPHPDSKNLRPGQFIGNPYYVRYHFDIRTKEILYPKFDK